jgi:3-hydroxyisobutyrate dehydrogenase-like beta-hydroxyacid dehydrogenase
VGEVAAEADIIITCLPSTAALRDVVRELKQAPGWGQIVVTAA